MSPLSERVAAYHPCVTAAPTNMLALFLRLLAYAAAQMGVLYLHLRMTTDAADVAGAKAWLAEGQTLEWIQVGILAAALLLLLSIPKPLGAFTWILVAALVATLAREMDAALSDWLWKNAHRTFMIAMAVVAVFFVWRGWSMLSTEISAFMRRPSFWLMFLGFTLVIIYALVLGQNAMWLERSAAGWDRVTKRFVEEGLEMCGYLWILFGALEERLARRTPA